MKNGRSMFQIRIHGRGGQGVVTAAELLSVAAFRDGKHAQAFPSFGSERTGAPVVSFCRISDREIRLREPVLAPDCLIVQDVTLFRSVDVFQGLKDNGYLLVNSSKTFEQLHIEPAVARLQPGRALIVPASELAQRHVGRPLPNAALLGAFAALTGLVSIDHVVEAIREFFSGKVGEANVAAARAAFDAALGERGTGSGGIDAQADRRLAGDGGGDRTLPP